MDYPRVQLQLNTLIAPFHPELSFTPVKIRIVTYVDEYRIDPTGLQTLIGSHQTTSPHNIIFEIHSTDFQHIYETLRRKRLDHQQCHFFASHIAPVANNRFGIENMEIEFLIKLTYEKVYAFDSDFLALLEVYDVVGRLVRECRIRTRSLDLESESCSICFDGILVSTTEKVPTRMSCSHVFHDGCISQWLRRNNSCPMCRRILYNYDQ